MGMSRNTTPETNNLANGNHSVASVHFENGSTVNIAKVEGSPIYKAIMEAAPHIHANTAASLTDSGVIVEPDRCDCYRAYRNLPETTSGVRFQSMQEYLPPWMGGPEADKPDDSTQSLTDMLRVLTFATETYQGTDISNATVSVPFPVGCGRVDNSSFEARVETAASALKLKLLPPTVALAGIKWEDRLAKRMKRSPYTYFSCHPDDEGFVLAVDFSDAALTATIQVTDCSGGDDFDYITRVLHSTELGARELFKTAEWREKFVAALRQATAPPIQGATDTERMNMLMLLGDAARDARLQEALRDVLGDQYHRLIATANDDGTSARDPEFLGAVAGVHWKWRKDHYYHSFDEFGCVPPGPYPYWGPKIRYHLGEIRDAMREWFRSADDKRAEAELAEKEERKRLLRELAQHPMGLGPP